MNIYNDALLPTEFNQLGIWIGLILSLLIFSLVIRDNSLARLAQYIFVGASLGYLTVLTWLEVLLPRLITPLLDNPFGALDLLIPAALGIILFVAGIQQLSLQMMTNAPQPRGWQKLLYQLAALPIALMVGIGVAVALIGALQGTVWPQFWRAAQMGIDLTAEPLLLVAGLLTLVITTGTLVYLTGNHPQLLAGYPRIVQLVVTRWAGLGKRTLWFAAGVIFARLVATRLSLLIARIVYFDESLHATGVWQWIASIIN